MSRKVLISIGIVVVLLAIALLRRWLGLSGPLPTH